MHPDPRRSFLRYFIFVIMLLGFSAGMLRAQEKEPDPDKPDQSDGVDPLSPKQLQLEQSFYYNHLDQPKPAWISSTLIRYGLVQRFELRLLVEQGGQRDAFMEQTAQSGYPVAISMKYNLLAEKKYLPAISLISYLQIPITNFSHEKMCWSQAYLLALQKKLDPLTLTINGGAQQEAFDYQWQWRLTTDLKYELSKKWSVFGEYFAQYSKGALPSNNLDAGVLYQIGKRCVLHGSAGEQIGDHTHNYFFSTGFVVHFAS